MTHRVASHNLSLEAVRERRTKLMYSMFLFLLSIVLFATSMRMLVSVGRVDPDDLPVVVTVTVMPEDLDKSTGG